MTSDVECDGQDDSQADQNGDDTMFELLRRVECRPFIYNSRDPMHSKRDSINQAWKDIAEGLKKNGKDVTDAWCRRQWKTKRDYYFKVKKSSKGKSGDGAKSKKPWAYFSAMERVLSSFVEENENTQSNFPGDDSNDVENHSPESQMTSDNNNSNGNEPASSADKESTPATSGRIRAPKRKLNENEQLLNEILKVLEEPEELKDQFYQFGMTICNKLRNLPIQTAEYAMHRISSVLFETMFPNEGLRDSLGNSATNMESTPVYTNNDDSYVFTHLK